MKQKAIEIPHEQINQELDLWFNNEACEALARETGFIQRRTSRLTGRDFFNLLTVEMVDEPTASYEGLCDRLEDRNPDLRITPQALCERMNSDGAVAFLKQGLKGRSKKQPGPCRPRERRLGLPLFRGRCYKTAPRYSCTKNWPTNLRAVAATPVLRALKWMSAMISNMNGPNTWLSDKASTAIKALPRIWRLAFNPVT